MASITITVVRTGQTIPSKVTNIPDADLDAIVAAYQDDAGASVGYAGVLHFIISQWYNQTRQRVQRANTVPAVVPPQINLN